jgi:hypothetical protein
MSAVRDSAVATLEALKKALERELVEGEDPFEQPGLRRAIEYVELGIVAAKGRTER